MRFSRRDFLKSSALFLTAAAAALSPKQIFSIRQSGGAKTRFTDARARRFGRLGQGLLEEEKFWFLTGEWLKNETFGRYKSNDKLYAMRREMVCGCRHLRLEGFDLDKCFIAGTARPSDKGARKYA